MSKISYIFILCFYVSIAHADILFLNLNLSTKEVETAQKAADARGEKLIALPQVSDEDQKKMNSLKNDIKKIQFNLNTKNIKSNQKSVVSSEELKLGSLVEELNAVSSKYKIDSGTLEDILKKYEEDKKTKLTSLIISGHHSLNFFGENGSELRYDDLENIINKYPEATKNIKSVYLWGCYSLTKKQVVFWKRAIPSSYILSGWDGSAPKDDKALDHEALFKLLVSEKKSSNDLDLKKSLTLFNSIGGVKGSSHAICIGSNYINTQGNENISDFLAKCNPEALLQYKKLLEVVNNYRIAQTSEFSEVPKNTGNSELREIYNKGRRIEHCDSYIEDQVNKIIFLIFDKQVRKNFGKVFESDLLKIDQILAKANLPPISTLFKDENMKRSDVVNGLNRMIQASYNANALQLNKNDKNFLYDMHHQFEEMLMKQSCMRPIWIEDVDRETLQKNISCMFSNCRVSGAEFSSSPISNESGTSTILNSTPARENLNSGFIFAPNE